MTGSIAKEGTTYDLIGVLFESQKEMSRTLRKEPLTARKARLRKLRDWILDNRKAIQHALYDDFKKPSLEVDATEIFPAIDEISNALSRLSSWVKPKKIDAPLTMIGTRSRIMYEPRGVCLIIAPWNYPFNLCVGPLVSALSAGNSVILKPSENTPNTAALISKMCNEVFDSRIVATCEGGAEVSQYLLSLPFDHIFFTGSPSVGKLVMKAAAEHLASVTLELGGKSPAIVTPGARIREAAKRIAVTKFINNGQTCLAPDYVLVHEAVAARFIEQLCGQVSILYAGNGNGIKESPDYARIVSDRHFERLTTILNDALEKGAKLHCGGEADAPTRFIHPVVLTGVTADMRLMNEEIFGPLLPVLTYTSLNEVLQAINERPKPLSLYIYGDDKAEQQRILAETSSGSVCINDSAVNFLHHNLPFGGVNQSGMGRAHGYYGFLAFSNEKSVLVQKRGFTSFEPFFPPYTNFSKKMMDLLLKLI